MQQCEVQSGETLVSISIREKISVTVLRRINKLYGNEIFPGQILSLRTSSNSPCKEKALLHNKNSNTILGDRVSPVATKHQNVMLKMSSEKGRDPIVATSHISAADRPTFSGNLSEMASNIKSAVAFSSEKNQDLIRSLLESMSIPSKENVENGRSRAASSSSIAGLSVSFTDKKVYDDEHYDSLPPILLGNSSILTISHAKQLRKYLPSMQQIENWRLLYSVLNDGADLCSFYRRSKNHKYTIIIAKTMKGEIFGGFQSTCWASASQNFCKIFVCPFTLALTSQLYCQL